jgi:DNA-binding CsgD family transcriptional regulator
MSAEVRLLKRRLEPSGRARRHHSAASVQRGAGSEKRERIRELRDQGLSYKEIGDELGLTKPTVAYHVRRLGVPADEKASRRYDWKAIQAAYDSGLTVRQCAARFGFCLAS